MNTYAKYCANVFVAKCTEMHQKGDIVEITTKYGQINNVIIYNLVNVSPDGYYYYSIVREDGYNSQQRALNKSLKYNEWSNSAQKKSKKYYEASQEAKGFLVLAEPIKVGHHSEKRHRALIARNWQRMGKSAEYMDKANEHENKANYWQKMAKDINLSMPESVDFYLFKLEEAKELQKGFKSGVIPKKHTYSLTYATKSVKDLQDKYDTAVKLWG